MLNFIKKKKKKYCVDNYKFYLDFEDFVLCLLLRFCVVIFYIIFCLLCL